MTSALGGGGADSDPSDLFVQGLDLHTELSGASHSPQGVITLD